MSAREVIVETLKETAAREARIPSVRAVSILSALAAAGYAVVPREPTRHMMECAVLRHHNRGSLAEIWTAMLAAAKEGEG